MRQYLTRLYTYNVEREKTQTMASYGKRKTAGDDQERGNVKKYARMEVESYWDMLPEEIKQHIYRWAAEEAARDKKDINEEFRKLRVCRVHGTVSCDGSFLFSVFFFHMSL